MINLNLLFCVTIAIGTVTTAFAEASKLNESRTVKTGEDPMARHEIFPGRSRCSGALGHSITLGAPRTFIWRPEWLAFEKQRVAQDRTYAKPLIDAANAALGRGPYSVIDKTTIAPSGDRHDYYSIGPYWWPTEGKPNGEPYSRRDGRVNPDSRSDSFDKSRMARFGTDVRVLALAYHHLGDRHYANHAANLLRAWFVSADTRMNPNLNHGQALPGVNHGRGEGIIELNALSDVVESIGLIEPAGAMTKGELASLKQWFTNLTQWMATSSIGKAERDKNNNHGLHYDYLITHFALFAGRETLAQQVVMNFPARRIAVQMKSDGSLPEELARTRSWHYSFYALEAATKLATLGECVGLDLWSAETRDDRGLPKAFAFLAPYQADMTKWPYKDTGLTDPAKRDAVRRVAMEPLRMMAWGTGNMGYERLAANHDVTLDATADYWLPPMNDQESAQP